MHQETEGIVVCLQQQVLLEELDFIAIFNIVFHFNFLR